MGEQETIDEAFHERNLAVLALAKALRNEFEVGWRHADDTNKWVVLYIVLPTGEVSWHILRELAEDLKWLKHKHGRYDGYGAEEKNKRLEEWVNGGQ